MDGARPCPPRPGEDGAGGAVEACDGLPAPPDAPEGSGPAHGLPESREAALTHPDDGPWTCRDVERWLIAAFRLMPMTPVYAPRGNTLKAFWGNRVPSATFDIVAFTGTVLGDRSQERRELLIWARSRATEGEVGGSITSYCEEHDISRRAFDKRRLRSCEKVAQEKNRQDGR